MQTVLATFDDRQTAQNAVDRLIAHGFTRSNVHLQSGVPETLSGARSDSEEGHGIMSNVGHFFSHLFGSDADAHAGNYSEAVRRGSSVVAVDASDEAEVQKATSVMHELGSVDVDRRAAQWKSKGWKGFDPNAGLMTSDEQEFEDQSVPVVEEKLLVGKQTLDVGGLRVIKRMTETPVSQIIQLRHERATIDRRAVDRAATDADFDNFRDGTVEVREMSEEAVVGKTARVVEEVRIGKEITQQSKTISDTVRGTDVDVERIEGSARQGPLITPRKL